MPAPATKFTNVRITGTLTIDGGSATAVGGAATINKQAGVITTESLNTAAGAVYTLTLTNSMITANSIVNVTGSNGTNTQGTPQVGTVTPGPGNVVIQIRNTHATQAFNGTLKISFTSINPA